MQRLKPGSRAMDSATTAFTFHYAKIKTYPDQFRMYQIINLHSTMQRLKLIPLPD